jgi:Domain of unknown function (DUF4190)
MTFCQNGHQLAAADHYCRSCGVPRPAGDYEPAGEYARPRSEQEAAGRRPSQRPAYQPADGLARGYWAGGPVQPAGYRTPAIGPYQPAQRYQPPGTNTLAIVSLVLGLLWFYWIGSLLAVILGIVSLRQIKDRDEQGNGLAVAGIVIGVAGLVTLVFVGLFALSVSHQVQPGING